MENLIPTDLSKGLKTLSLNLDSWQIQRLLTYIELLLKWNKVYSLTALTDKKQVLTHHILDGLTIINELIPYNNILDVGSGMGVPGIIIAICYPDKTVVTLDSNHKKTTFLNQVKIELGLNNLTVVSSRVEDYNPESKFDCIVSRAFTSMDSFIKLCKHLLISGGAFIAMKAKDVDGEIKSIEENYSYRLIPVSIPNISDQRFLLKIVI